MSTVVITDCDHASTAIEESIFAAAGLDVVRADCRDEAGVIEAGAGAAAMLTQYAPVTRRVIEALPALRAVARYGTGSDTIDSSAARRAGIRVVTVPDYAVSEVSDHAVALILALSRGVVASDRAVHDHRWSLGAIPPLRRTADLVVGVMGLGRIGSATALKLDALGFGVIGYDPLVAAGSDHLAVDLGELQRRADIVTLHLPLTEGTSGLVDAGFLGRLRRGVLLVNTSRGALVDEPALVAALRSGQVGGAGLDVLAAEPPAPGHPLLELPNVILTPHIAFYSREAIEELKRRVATGLVEALAEVAP